MPSPLIRFELSFVGQDTPFLNEPLGGGEADPLDQHDGGALQDALAVSALNRPNARPAPVQPWERVFPTGFRWLDGITSVSFVVASDPANRDVGIKAFSTRPNQVPRQIRRGGLHVVDGVEHQAETLKHRLGNPHGTRFFELINGAGSGGFEVIDEVGGVVRLGAAIEIVERVPVAAV